MFNGKSMTKEDRRYQKFILGLKRDMSIHHDEIFLLFEQFFRFFLSVIFIWINVYVKIVLIIERPSLLQDVRSFNRHDHRQNWVRAEAVRPELLSGRKKKEEKKWRFFFVSLFLFVSVRFVIAKIHLKWWKKRNENELQLMSTQFWFVFKKNKTMMSNEIRSF